MHGIKLPYHDPEIDKKAYEAWNTTGTLIKAAQKLKDDGVVSFRKTPFSPIGLRKAAVRYMIDHYDETRESISKLKGANGYSVDDENLDRFMIKMAVSAFRNPQRVKFWMIQNNLFEKYEGYVGALMAIE